MLLSVMRNSNSTIACTCTSWNVHHFNDLINAFSVSSNNCATVGDLVPEAGFSVAVFR